MDHDDGRSDKDRRRDEERRHGGKGTWGAPLPLERPIDPNELETDQVEIVDDFHNDFDDPEGWMAERATYWRDLGPLGQPTRMAWLRHRLQEARRALGIEPVEVPEPTERTSEEEWIRLSETALGPLPRREHTDVRTEARPAAPDARKSARKPAAYSQSKTAKAAGCADTARGAGQPRAEPQRRLKAAPSKP